MVVDEMALAWTLTLVLRHRRFGEALERFDQERRRCRVFHVRRAWINQLARHAGLRAFFLKLHAIVRRVRRVFLFLSERGRGRVIQIDRRIVSGDVFDGGIFLDPRQHLFAVLQKLRESSVARLDVIRVHKAERVSSVAAVRRPFLELLWIE